MLKTIQNAIMLFDAGLCANIWEMSAQANDGITFHPPDIQFIWDQEPDGAFTSIRTPVAAIFAARRYGSTALTDKLSDDVVEDFLFAGDACVKHVQKLSLMSLL